jgi:hypothetical protein
MLILKFGFYNHNLYIDFISFESYFSLFNENELSERRKAEDSLVVEYRGIKNFMVDHDHEWFRYVA